MAAVTDALTTAIATTTNAASYTSGAFTPVAGNLLVAFVAASGSTGASPTLTDTQNIGWTLISSAVKAVSADTLYLFVSNRSCAASSTTVTFGTSGGGTASGCIILIAQVTLMTRFGQDASRQTARQQNIASATPAPAFGVAALTGNPTLGCILNGTNPATMTTPVSWTERQDVGYVTPTNGAEYVTRDSGFTGTTVTWGSVSASNFASMIIELDTSARPPDPYNQILDPKSKEIEIVAY